MQQVTDMYGYNDKAWSLEANNDDVFDRYNLCHTQDLYINIIFTFFLQ